MHTKWFSPLSAALLVSVASTAAAQGSPVTFYGISVNPSGTPLPIASLRNNPHDLVNAAAHFGGDLVDVTPIAVDTAGATYYVGVNIVSLAFDTIGGELKTIPLPTPSSETITFRADKTRFVYDTGPTAGFDSSGRRVAGEVAIDCSHDVDEDTSVEEGVIVCKKKVVAQGLTEIVATTTGKPIALGAVTNAANLTLSTSESPSNISPTPIPPSRPADPGSGNKVNMTSLGSIIVAVALLAISQIGI
ncbi:hypothetical protein BKA70DRAFT_381793 [Coprinopsis sp. MPI-PUGE-AT-0042]|nr:hypothetical protein BKA70DRAFT_381793 [Coprinopsis sp. MPI-PUGE-AT-0042]